MRRLVAALVVLVIALSLTACSGESSEPPAASSSSTPPASASNLAPPPASGGSAAGATSVSTNALSARPEGTGVPFPTDDAQPKTIRTRLEERSPMVVFFYDPKQSSTKDVRRELDAAMKEYRGIITVVELDSTAAIGQAASKPTSESVAQQTALLAQTLKIDFTPYLVFVDRRGTITGRLRGYTERGLLEREILRATQ